VTRAKHLLVLSLAASLSAGTASAQIVECRGVTTELGPKVLLDEIAYLGAGPAPALLMRKVNFKMRTALEAAGLEAAAPRVVPCANRKPRGAGDFDRGIVERLDDNDALVEVWGVIAQTSAAGGSTHDVSLSYLLIPARRIELDSGRPQGVYETLFSTSPGSSIDDVLRVFDQSEELKAYIEIGAGLKAARSGRHEETQRSLCRGVLRLWPAGAAPANLEHRALLEYALGTAVKAVQTARADPRYDGPLKLLTPQQAALACGRSAP
jgi:hypothetical protein